MDVLTRIMDTLAATLRAELGADIFTDEQRQRYELALRQQEGRSTHYIASTDAYDRSRRNAEIIRHLLAGLSTQQAAERFGLTDRQIRGVRQQAIDAGQYKNGSAGG